MGGVSENISEDRFVITNKNGLSIKAMLDEVPSRGSQLWADHERVDECLRRRADLKLLSKERVAE